MEVWIGTGGVKAVFAKELLEKELAACKECVGRICLAVTEDEEIQELQGQGLLLYHTRKPEGEGYYGCWIEGTDSFYIIGGSETGLLYGALELCEVLRETGRLSRTLTICDAPVFRLRGPALGLQLTHIEPPRLTYEYPITPSRFPWFYDREQWLTLLDRLLWQRCNVIYLWSGHPFSSLIRLEEYPEALEVTEEEFAKNQEMFGWLTTECEKRGIWLVLKFYNIHIPYPFAIAHGLDQLQSKIDPLVADYTWKSIAKFIETFPHIGLMVCLGEALRGNQNKTDWFLKTIIPAVNEGVQRAGLKELPPLILRGHDCDPNAIMKEAVHMYGNIYTMWKYNGESLTTYLPTGKWQQVHQELSSHGQTHIMNVHILADLEPFRYGAPSFIQKCVQAGQNRLGANALHLYPLFYWDWPYSPDRCEPRLYQLDRDWMWYQAWFRYAWNPNRERDGERRYWIQELAVHFGCSDQTAAKLLEAMEEAGECMPRILRRIGITEGNRQTVSLGMTMSQLTNTKRYRPNLELWKSVSTPGEQLEDYVRKERKGEPHYGETPLQMVQQVCRMAEDACARLDAGKGEVTRAKEEFARWRTDLEAIRLLCCSYRGKVQAAVWILTYQSTMDEELKGDLELLRRARKPMQEALEAYQKVAALTKETYRYANSMQTPQRKIPFPDGDHYGHWVACLPEYEKEYRCFCRHLEEMEQGVFPTEKTETPKDSHPLPKAPFTLLSNNCECFPMKKGSSLFTDMQAPILSLAVELTGLTGIRMGLSEAIEQGVTIRLQLEEDSYVLIGYLAAKGVEWLQVPDLETNTHADDRGGLSVLYENAATVEGCPNLNIHAFRYEKGTHEIYLGTGGYCIAGIVPQSVQLVTRDAGLSGEALEKLDWLYEE